MVKNSCQADPVMQVTLDLREEQYAQRRELVEKLDKLNLWGEDTDKVLKIGSILQEREADRTF